eukprot:7583913-Heterocapsa_arctica.AAC.1
MNDPVRTERLAYVTIINNLTERLAQALVLSIARDAESTHGRGNTGEAAPRHTHAQLFAATRATLLKRRK